MLLPTCRDRNDGLHNYQPTTINSSKGKYLSMNFSHVIARRYDEAIRFHSINLIKYCTSDCFISFAMTGGYITTNEQQSTFYFQPPKSDPPPNGGQASCRRDDVLHHTSLHHTSLHHTSLHHTSQINRENHKNPCHQRSPKHPTADPSYRRDDVLPTSHVCLLHHIHPLTTHTAADGVVIHSFAIGAGPIKPAGVGCIQLYIIGECLPLPDVEILVDTVVAYIHIIGRGRFETAFTVIQSGIQYLPSAGEYLR